MVLASSVLLGGPGKGSSTHGGQWDPLLSSPSPAAEHEPGRKWQRRGRAGSTVKTPRCLPGLPPSPSQAGGFHAGGREDAGPEATS